MRYRLPELLKERDWTAYKLSQVSKGRISLSTAYRLVRQKGKVKQFDGALMDALCEALEIEVGVLLEREGAKRSKVRKVG